MRSKNESPPGSEPSMVGYPSLIPASDLSCLSYGTGDSDDASSIVSRASSGVLEEIVNNFKTALVLPTDEHPCHDEESSDPEDAIVYDEDGHIICASQATLLRKLTSDVDHKFADDFLLTYRFFMRPLDLARSLAGRLERSFREEDQSTKLRTFVVIRDWLQGYWKIDFERDHTIRGVLYSTLQRLNALARSLTLADHQILNKLHKLLETVAFDNDERASLLCPSFSRTSLASGGVQSKADSWRAKFKDRFLSLMNIKPSDWRNDERTPLSILEDDSPTVIAEHLCIVEARRLEGACWTDLLPASGHKTKSSPSVLQFNASCKWFTDEVTKQSADAGRQARLLTCLIRTAAACLHLNNFNSLVQITLALQSPTLSDLHEAWGRLTRRDTRFYHDLLAYCSPLRGFHHLRRAMWDLGAAAPAELCATPCIPFTGLFMSDLSSSKEQLDNIIENKRIPGGVDSLRIPWCKCKAMARTIRLYRVLQASAKHYSFETRSEFLNQLEVSQE